MLADDAQDTVWAEYTPFGQASITTEVITNNLRFPGQYYDAETGLHYNYFRDYDPSTGRYITSDPIGLSGGVNTYGYVGGNPITRLDRLGLFATLAAGAPAPPVGQGSSAGGFDGNAPLLPPGLNQFLNGSSRDFQSNSRVLGCILTGYCSSANDRNIVPFPGAGEMIDGQFCPNGKCIRTEIVEEKGRTLIGGNTIVPNTTFRCKYKCASGRSGERIVDFPGTDPSILRATIDILCPVELEETELFK